MVTGLCMKQLTRYANAYPVILCKIHAFPGDESNLALVGFAFLIKVAGRVAKHTDGERQFQKSLLLRPVATANALIIWRSWKRSKRNRARKPHNNGLVAEARFLHGEAILRCCSPEEKECQQESVHSHLSTA